MQTLIPESVTAIARPHGRFGRILAFGLTPRALLLLLAGTLLSIPSFFHPHHLWIMLAWDALVAALILFDLAHLPPPAELTITRRFLHSPALGDPTEIVHEILQRSNALLEVRITDDLHPALVPKPQTETTLAYPRDSAKTAQICHPNRRGDFALGKVFLRYRGALRLVERWAVADLEQPVRVFPATEKNTGNTGFYLMRARQIELQKRRLRMRGTGREFESLRDYQPGDEMRNISWTATARRAHVITREFTTERSQKVWIVLDAGRLSRTAFKTRRSQPEARGEVEQDAAEQHLLTVTQLDQAASAAVMLAQVIAGSGDKFALLTYGRRVQQQLLPGAGPSHLRMLIDHLSQVHSEASEADHLHAVARLKNLQRRRGLIVWITEMAESVGRPEVVTAAAELIRRHFVVLVLLIHPELEALAVREPRTVDEMFASAAAHEMLERRRATVALLRQQGALVVETSPGEVGAAAITKYLEVKARVFSSRVLRQKPAVYRPPSTESEPRQKNRAHHKFQRDRSMSRREKSLQATRDGQHRNCPRDQSDGLPSRHCQGVLPSQHSWKQQPGRHP